MKHLTGIDDLSDADIAAIMKMAETYAADPGAGRGKLAGRTVINMFLENSTRTRISFDMATLRLGGTVINWDEQTSSMKKGESFGDTVRTLAAMKPDAVIVRSAEYNAAHYVSTITQCPVINAGDSWREHPTQALLDAFTIKQKKGRIEGLTVAICGDVGHSRVAGSNMKLLTRLGAKVRLIAPSFLMPQTLAVDSVEKFTTMEEGLPGCDIVMMLRNQKERMDPSQVPDDASFFRQYGLTHERLELARADALVMHPAPMNRGVEIADEVADDPRRSLIFTQIANGVPVRMAVLDLLLNS